VVVGMAVLATAAAAAVSSGVAMAPRAGATYPGVNGQIAFSATKGGVDQVWTMTATGSNKTRITSPPRENTDPAWNGPSTRIVFSTVPPSGTSQIFEMNPVGHLRTQITHGTRSYFDPVKNAADTKIVASGTVKGVLNLFMMNVDGTHVQRFTKLPSDDVNPDFSPDGTKVTWERDRPNGTSDIMIKNANGTGGAVQLTSGGGNDITPTYAPSGTRIGYSHIVGNKGTARIWSMNPDGTGKTKVTNNAVGTFYDNPQYSPDGGKFVFIREKSSTHPTDIFTIDTSGGNLERFTDGNFIVTGVAWGSA
jgi:TolB protein